MPIGMTLSSLKRMEQLPAKAKKALSVIDRNLQIQVKLIDDLLDLSRAIKESRDPQHRERVNIHEVFASAKEVCMADLRRKKQTVETREEARVPFVQGDRARLQQVFWNLLRNASKFSPEGATISASFSNQNGNVIFQMADPGIGIPRPLLGKIFNLYEQGGSKEGLGLGLWISRTIVNAHGGTIRARSRGPGQGATFIIILPCSPGSKKSSLRAGTNRQQP
jgi:signal transduction histidine kinase